MSLKEKVFMLTNDLEEVSNYIQEAILEDKKNLTKYESGLITFDEYLKRRKEIFGDL